jgi:4-amino-4-deoxy-L-arabinose transferase-like glycosyltransferase
MGKIKSFVINHKTEVIILIVILLVGAFVRLYKIDQYMTFLGDEGRDVIIVRRLLIEHHPPLIGPGTSIGNMYLGPAYYYMMALPLLFFNFNPVGPAVFIAILGVMTIFFLWWVVKEWFGDTGASIAAFLYAISPVVIIYSRSSWNPNIMPFFALAAVYFMWRVWIKQEFKSLIIVGISFAFILQSHYLGLLLLPTFLLMWIITYFKTDKKRNLIIYSVISLVLFLLLMSPLAIFDIRHNFINFKAMKAFFSDRQTTVSVLPWKAIPGMWPLLNMITADLVGAKNMTIGLLIASIISIYFAFNYFIQKEKFKEKNVSVILTLSLWLGFGLIGMALYKQHIYDHYFGFLFAAPFIILGGVIQYVINHKNKIGYLIVVSILLGIVFVDVQNSPLQSAPNKQLERAQIVSKKVEEVANGEKFNFALIADNNYDSAYRYFLNIDNSKVTDINVQDTKNSITPQLIVVCERVKEKCDPTHNAKTEIAAWGWSKIDEEWDHVDGVTIYKLGHVPMPVKK